MGTATVIAAGTDRAPDFLSHTQGRTVVVLGRVWGHAECPLALRTPLQHLGFSKQLWEHSEGPEGEELGGLASSKRTDLVPVSPPAPCQGHHSGPQSLHR